MKSTDGKITIHVEKAKKEDNFTCYFKVGSMKKYIWSKYNPKKVAEQSISFQEANKETVWIVLGIGLGYVAREILNKAGEYARVILVEPTRDLMECQNEYIGELLDNPRVRIICGEDKEKLEKVLADTIEAVDLDNIKMISHPVYTEVFKEYYTKMVEYIKDYLREVHIKYNTITKYSEENLKNLIRNREAIKKSKDIGCYHNRFKNIPAVIVSAGPSLNKNIKHLKDFKGIIFTGGRTLPHVFEQEVMPQFLVSIDPTDRSYDTLKEHKENECNLICTEITNALVVRYNKGNQYFLGGTQGNLAEKLLGVNLTSLPMNGSVATLCLSSAYYMGCNPIVFIGQDLAYTDFKAHVDKFQSYEVDKEDKSIRYIEGIDGKLVASDISLIVFLRWIEKFIQDTKDQIQYINCTEGGANIKGTQISTFKEIVGMYKAEYKLDCIHKDRYNQEERENIEENLKKAIQELKEICNIADKGIKTSKKLKEEYIFHKGKRQDKVNKLLQELEKSVDSKLKRLNGASVEVFIREYTKMARKKEYKVPFKENEEQRNLRIIEMSYNLYKNIYDATSKTLEIIEENIN